MRGQVIRIGFALLTVLVGIPAFAQAQGSTKLEVGDFSAAAVGLTLPEGWTPLTCKKIERHTTKVSLDGN